MNVAKEIQRRTFIYSRSDFRNTKASR